MHANSWLFYKALQRNTPGIYLAWLLAEAGERGAPVTANLNKLDCSSKEDRNAVKVENEKNTVYSEVNLDLKQHLLLSTEITAKNYIRLALESTDHIIRKLTNGFKTMHNDIYDTQAEPTDTGGTYWVVLGSLLVQLSLTS